MRKPVFQAVASLSIAMSLMSCAPSALVGLGCPPPPIVSVKELACLVNNDHQVQVGNSGPPAIPNGTIVTFTAKLENAGNHCATVKISKPVPPHLFITITGQPLFDGSAPCKAWRKVELVNTQ